METKKIKEQDYHVSVVNDLTKLVDEIIKSIDTKPYYNNYDFVTVSMKINGVTKFYFQGEGEKYLKQLSDLFYTDDGDNIAYEADEYAHRDIKVKMKYGYYGVKYTEINTRFVSMGNTYIIREYKTVEV